MDEEEIRLAKFRLKNIEYIRRLEERELAKPNESEFCLPLKRKKTSQSAPPKNKISSVYVTGLTTYIACKQLEGFCGQLGKIRRIKFYKDERGGLKGDALVTFLKSSVVPTAIQQLDNMEIKPGIVIRATVAEFKPKEQVAEVIDAPEGMNQQLETNNVISSAPKTRELSESEQNVLPSKKLILVNVFDPEEAKDCGTFYQELQGDMEPECSKYGKLLAVGFYTVKCVESGSVLVEYDDVESALKCYEVMDGRWFGGRKISAKFDHTSHFEIPNKTIDEDDAKLQDFLSSI